MDDLLDTTPTPSSTWVDSYSDRVRLEHATSLDIAATLRFRDGTSIDLEIPTTDGQIPEWYTWFVPLLDLKYVGISQTHRATYIQVRP